jgi:hypothetical protein
MKRKVALALIINLEQDKMKQPLQFKLTTNDDKMTESMVKRGIMWSQGSHGVKEMDHIAKGHEGTMGAHAKATNNMAKTIGSKFDVFWTNM